MKHVARFYFLQACRYAVFALVLAMPFAARAEDEKRPDATDVEFISRLHCQLWLRSEADTAPLNGELLDRMVGMPGYYHTAGARQLAWLDLMEWLPDFGFIAADRWPSFTRAERNAFNRAFGGYLARSFRMQAPGGVDERCAMQITISRKVAPENSGPEVDIWRAVAYAQIRSFGKSAPLIYALDFNPQDGWRISDIVIGSASMNMNYDTYARNVISRYGVAGFVRAMERGSKR